MPVDTVRDVAALQAENQRLRRRVDRAEAAIGRVLVVLAYARKVSPSANRIVRAVDIEKAIEP